MKSIRKIGLTLFLAGISIFIASLFIGSYKISEASLNKAFASKVIIDSLGGENTGARDTIVANLTKTAKELEIFEKEFGSQFTFSGELSNLFNKSNESISNELAGIKGISEEEKEAIYANSIVDGKVIYSDEIVIKTFPENESKQKLLRDNTNWMFAGSKEYANVDDFKNDFENKLKEINGKLGVEYFVWDNKYSRFDLAKASSQGPITDNKGLFLFLTFGLCIVGSLMYILPGVILMGGPGIKNNGIYHDPTTNRGWIGIAAFSFLFSFYILLYFYPSLMVNWTSIVDPLKQIFVSGGSASQWFLYGTLYTTSMTVMGIRMIIKYRHSNYQIVRTITVVLFQIIFAFLLVEILPLFGLPGMDLKNAWPLDYDFFFDWNVKAHFEAGRLGIFMFVWGIILTVVFVPLFVYLYGKRWYCSWVCGCGGLAETLGDPFRQLSDKRLVAWKLERWLLYPIFGFVIIMTIWVSYHSYNEINHPEMQDKAILLGISAHNLRDWYGFLIGSIFAGVIGTGFYPLLGNRAWCRFGCPLAAYLGIVQRLKSKFRITTNGGQCISCGNCSTYCEQGIDVRAYAQKGQNIVRAACVGCGVCSEVCPRGVLNLENGPNTDGSRMEVPEVMLGNEGLKEFLK